MIRPFRGQTVAGPATGKMMQLWTILGTSVVEYSHVIIEEL